MDYRSSHSEKGGSYDKAIAESPQDAYMHRWEAEFLPGFVRAAFPQGIPRYLDFACGTGRITGVIAPLAKESTGVDISPTMLESARSKLPGVRFVLGDLTRESLGLGQFDLISAFRFFGNAQPALRDEVLAALKRHLAPGGALLINNHRNPRTVSGVLARMLGERSKLTFPHAVMEDLFARHGFRTVASRPIGAWMYRASVMNDGSRSVEKERKLEERFASPALSAWAPDSLILARLR